MVTPPFIDPATTELDTSQIYAEAVPVAALVLLFGALALIPFLLVVGLGAGNFVGIAMTLLAQLIAAVGAGIVLMYVIARGIQLSGAERTARTESTAKRR